MNIASTVGDDEIVGHDMTQGSVESALKVTKINRSMRKSFNQDGAVSVNRVSEAQRLDRINELTAIILTRPTDGNQHFKGWVKLAVSAIQPKGYTVSATPTPPQGQMAANPFHAGIELPVHCLGDPEEEKSHIKFLAELAQKCWHPKPEI